MNVQGRGVGAIREVTLISHWGSGSVQGPTLVLQGPTSSFTQSISANGVEEFHKDNRAGLGAQTRLGCRSNVVIKHPDFGLVSAPDIRGESDRTASMPAPRF